MKKILLVFGIIVLIPFFVLGFYFLESVYYEAMDYKAEKATIKYLEEKYGERFKIDDVQYEKILGDEGGGYTLYAHPIKKSEFSIQIFASERYQVIGDDYKESKWGYQYKQEIVQVIEPIFPETSTIYAYGSFTEEIEEQYQFKDSYQTIFNENPLQNFERLNIFNFNRIFEKEKELERLYKVLEVFMGRKVGRFQIELNYYPKELSGKLKGKSDPNQFENEHRDEIFYICRISSEDLQENPISSPGDIEPFCRKM
jgi:hypothetical protein